MHCAAEDSYSRHRHSPVRMPGCTPAPRRHCRRSTCFLLRDPRRQDWNKTLARMRFAFRRPCVTSTSTRDCLTSVPCERVCGLSDCADLASLQTLFRRAVQERHRHNHEVDVFRWPPAGYLSPGGDDRGGGGLGTGSRRSWLGRDEPERLERRRRVDHVSRSTMLTPDHEFSA